MLPFDMRRGLSSTTCVALEPIKVSLLSFTLPAALTKHFAAVLDANNDESYNWFLYGSEIC